MSTASDARFWNRTSRRYSKARIADEGGYERTLERTRSLLPPGARVLELGCGTGSTALRLADGVRSYLATDISEQMIAIAEEKRAANPAGGLAFRTATAESIAAEPDRYDAVLGFNYLHLVRDPKTVLRHIHDLLMPGGLFISKTPCVSDMNVPIRRVILPAMGAVRLAPHVSVFSAQDLIGLQRGVQDLRQGCASAVDMRWHAQTVWCSPGNPRGSALSLNRISFAHG